MLPFFSILSANFFSTVLQFETNFENVKKRAVPFLHFYPSFIGKVSRMRYEPVYIVFFGGVGLDLRHCISNPITSIRKSHLKSYCHTDLTYEWFELLPKRYTSFLEKIPACKLSPPVLECSNLIVPPTHHSTPPASTRHH